MRDISPIGLLLDVDGPVASGDLPDVAAGESLLRWVERDLLR
ncbi:MULTISPECIES: hypothetical protein [Micrococcus]|nr:MULTISPECIES: hypothetical protein [Micrococcus]WIK82054.1 hypothetical protein CJ228_010785 [Micrococcus lylae]